MKRMFCLILVLVTLFPCMPVFAKEESNEELQLHARAALLMDAATGRVLYEKDGYTPYAVASTTKILTAILVLEEECEEEYAQVSANAARQPKVKLNVKKGESYKVKDLLYSLLLESHNDTAVVLAEHVAKDTETFAKRMNKKAEEIGCENSYFITPNGLDATVDGKANCASAYDMALIANYALKNERFLEIIQTGSYTFSDKEGRRMHEVQNANSFLDIYPGAIGVKTGFTNLAGYCFVGAADTECGRLICVVLGSGWPPKKTLKWNDSKALLDYGSDNFERVLLEIPSYTGERKVLGGTVSNISVEGKSRELSCLVQKNDKIQTVIFMEYFLQVPIEKNTKTGWKRIYINEEIALEQTILTTESCAKKKFSESLQEILHGFYI